jgi:hypothetical protein
VAESDSLHLFPSQLTALQNVISSAASSRRFGRSEAPAGLLVSQCRQNGALSRSLGVGWIGDRCPDVDQRTLPVDEQDNQRDQNPNVAAIQASMLPAGGAASVALTAGAIRIDSTVVNREDLYAS